ncbi:ABC transporter ATP-binding protein [Ensifer sp. ENS10]|uniref:ABC transporter ATP-binding protein n=1 Tax=unclassified Ensifer TaxID=2633371 RepID=UPI000708C4FD|nr:MULTISPECIES: ABC transporter ATP-binding protein [unclassified Ensifer]KRD60462.1 glycerol-3-phosphate ABC transporter ATP-binding protein [Ensifer sp. Root278]MBD9508450.1 ABC transporter ATP-binding protein [Ensifer sp. ENS10]
MSVLSLDGITKSYGGNAILKGVSLEAEVGEFIALVGPSGCGKSTLLRIVAGLDHGDTGEIVIGGRSVVRKAAADRNVAMVFQSYALYPHLTAGENIAVPLAMRRLTAAQRLPFVGNVLPGQKQIRTDIQRQVKEMALALKIDHLLDRKPGQMSGGQRQRVALARAMVRRPAVFLMDEPLSNLDANLRVHARGEIVDLHRRAGVPTLYVTHDQSEALSMADRVAVMIGGNLLQLANPKEIYDNPSHVEVARFLGQPKINVVETRTDAAGIVRFGDLVLMANRGQAPDAPVKLAVRPEFVRFSPQGAGRLSARVERMEFLGSEVIVHARLDAIGEVMTSKSAPAEAASLAIGQPVDVEIMPERAMLFDHEGARLPAEPLAVAATREKIHG